MLDIIKAMEKACGDNIPYKIEPRRGGDVATLLADPSKAKNELNWEATRTLEDMCKDLWNFHTTN